jgi:CRP/FNR family cyclic AMP-dependent transcriptional regulator
LAERIQDNVVAEGVQLSEARFPDLFTHKREIIYDAGHPAFDSDDTLHHFYFVLDGKIKISQINLETSKEQTLQLLSRGDMYDVITLMDNKPHEFVSMALERSTVLQVPLSHMRELLNSSPEFNRYFFPYLSRQMRNMEALAVDLSLYDVYHRLLRLIGRSIDPNDEASELHLINNLSHEELASLIGTVRKVVNRSLQQLKSEGIIDISRKQLELKDLQKLLDKLETL